MNRHRKSLESFSYRFLLASSLTLMLLLGCEMGEEIAADHSFEVYLHQHQEPESVTAVVHDFSAKFGATVLGGPRDRQGSERYVLEVHFPSNMLFTISNFVKEDVFIVTAYSGSDPSYSDTLEYLLKSLEAKGFSVAKRSLTK